MSNQNHEIRYTLTRLETSPPRCNANSAIGSHSQPLGLPLPRITRLMALAIKLEHMRRDPNALSYGEMAQLGHVSRARLTQIMNLLHLAPDIRERLLFLPPVEKGREPLNESALRKLTGYYDWAEQRQVRERMRSSTKRVR